MLGMGIETELSGEMIYIANDDAPGFIGRLGTTLGEAGVNLGTFQLGRRATGGEAVLLLSVDSHVDRGLFERLKALSGATAVKRHRLSAARLARGEDGCGRGQRR